MVIKALPATTCALLSLKAPVVFFLLLIPTAASSAFQGPEQAALLRQRRARRKCAPPTPPALSSRRTDTNGFLIHYATSIANTNALDSLSLPSPPQLTVLIPAYNEELRIRPTLEKCQRYLSEQWQGTKTAAARANILVVDDGSSDGTVYAVREFASSSARTTAVPIECLAMPDNQGKGAALECGIQRILNSYYPDTKLILTTDADGSADMAGIEQMYKAILPLVEAVSDRGEDNNNGAPNWDTAAALVNGYRTYSDDVDESSALSSRKIFRWGFQTVVRLVCGDLGVRDSQCGFKLMTVPAARTLYADLHLKGWSHDVEVFYRAREQRQCGGVRVLVTEQPIRWQDQDGSKLVSSPGGILAVILRMFLDVLLLPWLI